MVHNCRHKLQFPRGLFTVLVYTYLQLQGVDFRQLTCFLADVGEQSPGSTPSSLPSVFWACAKKGEDEQCQWVFYFEADREKLKSWLIALYGIVFGGVAHWYCYQAKGKGPCTFRAPQSPGSLWECALAHPSDNADLEPQSWLLL